MEFKVLNQQGKADSEINLSEEIFAQSFNEDLVHQLISIYIANGHPKTKGQKNRASVQGGGKKPWKQKGTGRSRIGSLRNPSRVHGGAAFGPRSRQYSLKVNKKIKHLARKSVLTLKVLDKKFLVIDDFSVDTNKTKDLLTILNALKIDRNDKIIILSKQKNDSIYLSSRNVKNIVAKHVNSFSTYDIIINNFLLIDKSSVEYLNESLG